MGTGAKNVGQGILNFYTLTWVDGVVVAAIVYYILYRIWPFELGSDEPDLEIKYTEEKESSERSMEKDEQINSQVVEV
jgi:hypothetical protein